MNPIPDPDMNRAAPMDNWPEAPALFDPQDRSARHLPTTNGPWGAVPAVWPEQRAALVAAPSRPARRAQTAFTAATVQPPRLVQPSGDDASQLAGVVRQPIAATQPPQAKQAPASSADEGWRRADDR